MRASKKVAVAFSLLLASTMASQSFIDSADFGGRKLQEEEIWTWDELGTCSKTTQDASGSIIDGPTEVAESECLTACNDLDPPQESACPPSEPAEDGDMDTGNKEAIIAASGCPEVVDEAARTICHADGAIHEAEFPEYTGFMAPWTDASYFVGLEGMPQVSLIGIIVGFSVTGIFIIFAIVNIIIDETQRHAQFSEKVQSAANILQDKYEVKEDELAEMFREFAEKDAKGSTANAEEERKELA